MPDFKMTRKQKKVAVRSMKVAVRSMNRYFWVLLRIDLTLRTYFSHYFGRRFPKVLFFPGSHFISSHNE